MEKQKYQDYNPDTSEIEFRMVQEYRSVLNDHFKEYKLDSIKKLNENIISVYFITFKAGGGKTKEEQFRFELISSLKVVYSKIYDHLNE